MDDYSVFYVEDKTQWDKSGDPIEVEYDITVNLHDDSAIVSLLKKLSQEDFGTSDINIRIYFEINSDNNRKSLVTVNSVALDDVSRREFLRSLRSSNCLLLHNSTKHIDDFYMMRGRPSVMYDLFLSEKDRQSLSDAEAILHRKMKKVASDHRSALDSMLDKLRDHYDVEFSTPDFPISRRVPLNINLSEKTLSSRWQIGEVARKTARTCYCLYSAQHAYEAERHRIIE